MATSPSRSARPLALGPLVFYHGMRHTCCWWGPHCLGVLWLARYRREGVPWWAWSKAAGTLYVRLGPLFLVLRTM